MCCVCVVNKVITPGKELELVGAGDSSEQHVSAVVGRDSSCYTCLTDPTRFPSLENCALFKIPSCLGLLIFYGN